MNKDVLKSKKFTGMVVGIIVTALITLIPALEEMEEHITQILGVVIAYIGAQGLADFQKEASK